MSRNTVLTCLNVVVLTMTSIAGLFFPRTYTGFIPPRYLAESQGQDATTLFLGLPLLLLAVLRSRKGDVRGPIFWAGAMGYFLYVNLIYAYGGVYNVYFFAYVGACGFSLFTLISLLTGMDIDKMAKAATSKLPRKRAAVFFVVTALMLSFMWGVMAIDAIFARRTVDATVIVVTDFMVIIPAYVFTAIWLWKRRPWGIVLTGVLLVQAVTLGCSIIAGQIVTLVKGMDPAWGLGGFFLFFTLIALAVTIPYVRAFQHPLSD